MKRLLIIGATCLVGCLPLEPTPTKLISWYNFCPLPIELRNANVPDEVYAKKKGLIIDTNTNKTGEFYSKKSTEIDQVKDYFIENGIKKHFKVDQYNDEVLNLIACPENAKPTGDGNWIKAN